MHHRLHVTGGPRPLERRTNATKARAITNENQLLTRVLVDASRDFNH
jgi:hypothetical protein